MVSTLFLVLQIGVFGFCLTAVILCILEVILRILRPGLDGFYVLVPCQRKVHHLAAGVMPGMGNISRFHTNSKGIRGREFSSRDRYRILAMGCSVAISTYVDQSKTWTALLEQRLSECLDGLVWVGNVGRSEVTTRDVINFVRYFLPQYVQDIDAVIVLVGVNDFALMLSKGPDYDPDFWSRAGIYYQMKRVFERRPNRYSGEPFYRRWAVWKLFGCVKRRLMPNTYDQVGEDYVQLREKRQNSPAILDTLPDVTPGLDEYECNLHTIIDLIQGQSVRPIFLTQPCLWRGDLSSEEENLLWFGWVAGISQYYSSRVLAEGMALYNHRLLKVCQIRGVECLDLSSALPKGTGVFYDDVHLNEGGSDLVAQEVGQFLAQSPPFTDRDQGSLQLL